MTVLDEPKLTVPKSVTVLLRFKLPVLVIFIVPALLFTSPSASKVPDVIFITPELVKEVTPLTSKSLSFKLKVPPSTVKSLVIFTSPPTVLFPPETVKL